jgi:preprotein translocase subunit SecY
MPIIVRWLSQYQGALTKSRLDRAVVGRYFAFLVLSQLVVFTFIWVIFSECIYFYDFGSGMLMCVFVDSVRNLIIEANQHETLKQIIENLHTRPDCY